MRTFGIWLWGTPLTLSEVAQLRTVVTALGQKWPIESDDRGEYEKAVRNAQDIDQTQALEALNSLWPVYEMAEPGTTAGSNISRSRLNLGALSVIAICVLGFGSVLLAFNGSDLLYKLGQHETARGLLSFLFGVTAIVIAIIVVIANYSGSGQKDELAARFQRGKDILTPLLVMFGVILGYYFGVGKGTP